MKYVIRTLDKPYTIEVKPKQKVILIKKNSNGIDIRANNKAQAELSIVAYCLYMRLVKLKDNTIWTLSNNEIEKSIHLSIHQYNNAVAELLEKKYLVRNPIDIGGEIIEKNTYCFYEDLEYKAPQPVSKINPKKTFLNLPPAQLSRANMLSNEVF